MGEVKKKKFENIEEKDEAAERLWVKDGSAEGIERENSEDTDSLLVKELIPGELREIIVYLSYKLEFLTEKRLMKIFYLAELYHIEKYGKRLSDLRFLNYTYGVWSPDLRGRIDLLNGIDIKITNAGDRSFITALRKPDRSKLSEEVVNILDTVIDDFSYQSTNYITNTTKNTLPWEKSKFGELIDFEDYIRDCEEENEYYASDEFRKKLAELDRELAL